MRSGKSVGLDYAFLDFALTGPPGNLALVGKTGDTIYRNVIEPMVQLFGRSVCVFNRGTRELRIGGRLVYVVGANDERAQDKMRGVSLVGAYVDELTTIPESFWSMLLTRLSDDGARAMGTTNPDSPMHWLKRNYLDRAGDLDLAAFHFRLEDNPYLPPEYVEAIKAEQTGLWRRRFIEGEWVAAEGAVYETLDVTPGGRHVAAELPVHLDHFTVALDYGTTNPTHVLIGAIGHDAAGHGRLYVCREWVSRRTGSPRKLTDVELSQRIDAFVREGAGGLTEGPVPTEAIVIDPSAASMRQQLQRDGWGWAALADNAVLDGIKATASLLATGRLVIHESCAELLRELSGYVWDPKAEEKGTDAPLKVDDHGPDALRYMVMHLRRYWRDWLVAGPADYGMEEAAA